MLKTLKSFPTLSINGLKLNFAGVAEVFFPFFLASSAAWNGRYWKKRGKSTRTHDHMCNIWKSHLWYILQHWPQWSTSNFWAVFSVFKLNFQGYNQTLIEAPILFAKAICNKFCHINKSEVLCDLSEVHTNIRTLVCFFFSWYGVRIIYTLISLSRALNDRSNDNFQVFPDLPDPESGNLDFFLSWS